MPENIPTWAIVATIAILISCLVVSAAVGALAYRYTRQARRPFTREELIDELAPIANRAMLAAPESVVRRAGIVLGALLGGLTHEERVVDALTTHAVGLALEHVDEEAEKIRHLERPN